MMFTTKNLGEVTFAKVTPEEVTPEEKRLIMEGSLGYCAAHHNLYRKISEERLNELGGAMAMLECPVMAIACKCDNPACTAWPKLRDLGTCEEW